VVRWPNARRSGAWSPRPQAGTRWATGRSVRIAPRVAVAASAVLAVVAVPGILSGPAVAASLSPSAGAAATGRLETGFALLGDGHIPANLKATLARAAALSNQIDSLSQQYDGLKIQLSTARRQAKLASQAAARDDKLISVVQAAIGHIAAQGYMTGSLDPALQLLQSANPQQLLNRASIMQQLAQENGDRLSVLAAAAADASRARTTAAQEASRATALAAQMRKKVTAIEAREKILNSAAFSQAMAIFRRTGHYPNISVTGDTIGAQALRYALTRLGDPYVWGGAGPDDFDCSGLVMWAYAQVGISLPHYTGYQWNAGEHISRSQLEPGDLVFFFPDISHVGMYVGNGEMIDAPTFGQPVQIQPIYWSAFVGAVRIVA
jgi:cell wall-associated NlpC family hydrolase